MSDDMFKGLKYIIDNEQVFNGHFLRHVKIFAEQALHLKENYTNSRNNLLLALNSLEDHFTSYRSEECKDITIFDDSICAGKSCLKLGDCSCVYKVGNVILDTIISLCDAAGDVSSESFKQTILNKYSVFRDKP